jgi:hypothetical protein
MAAQGRARRAYEVVEGQVAERPISAVAVAFGLGIGAGLGLGLMLSGSRPAPARSARRSAEQLGRSLLDALGRSLPESLTAPFSR